MDHAPPVDLGDHTDGSLPLRGPGRFIAVGTHVAMLTHDTHDTQEEASMASAYVDTNWLERAGFDDGAREPSSKDDAADLWPCEERALAAWEAHRVRRSVVRAVGVACMAALCAVFVRVGTSPAARSEMMAWGTMGKVVQPHATAVMAPPAAPAAPREEKDAAADPYR